MTNFQPRMAKPRITLDISHKDTVYTWSVFPKQNDQITKQLAEETDYQAPTETGITLVTLLDNSTKVKLATSIADPEVRVAAHRAWAAARHSRSPGDTEEIMAEMGLKGVDPDAKLDETFRGYGHASPAGLAITDIGWNNVPLHVPLTIFNWGIMAGQEKSTRYQKRFSQAVLHSLENYLDSHSMDKDLFQSFNSSYQNLGELAQTIFNQFEPRVREAYLQFYGAPGPGQKGALDARVFDTVRFALLLGQNTGFSILNSALDCSKLIGALKSSAVKLYRSLGEQLQCLLSPGSELEQILGFKAEVPSLIKYAEADYTVQKNLVKLEQYLTQETDLLDKVPKHKEFLGEQPQSTRMIDNHYSAAVRMTAQYVLTLFPSLEAVQVLQWLYNHKNINNEVNKTISKLIFASHDHHHEMPLNLARTTQESYLIRTQLGELRDLNRHRASGRFIQWRGLIDAPPITYETAQEIQAQGFGLPLYLTEVDAFKEIKVDFSKSLEQYYSLVRNFLTEVNQKLGSSIEYSFMINLLPLAHQINLWLHDDPRQDNYLPKLRVRPGGHINYRVTAFEINQLAAASDPLLSALAFPENRRPNPVSREEFYDRS